MEGSLEKDGEQMESQPEIAEVTREEREGQDEQPVKGSSMVERIPRFVSGIGAGEDINIRSAGSARPEGRESDIAMAVKMVKVVEEDAAAVAGRLAGLFSSLQSALSEVTGSSIEHMRCHSEAAGLLQDASIDAASKGQRFINSCLRLNEEMKSIGSLATQLKTLRQVVDQFEYHASRSLPRL